MKLVSLVIEIDGKPANSDLSAVESERSVVSLRDELSEVIDEDIAGRPENIGYTLIVYDVEEVVKQLNE